MAGDIWPDILPNAAMLAACAIVLLGLTRASTKKQLA